MEKKQVLIDKDKCPRCGNEFYCGKSGKCWCYEVSVSAETQEAINKKYDSCLCPECLKSLGENPGQIL
ncbi:MAG: cysteine-rich CWC family protein [Bacteroidales bacterium]|jgi:ribosomal protein L34E